MKKINYLAAAFALSFSLAFLSCNKNDDEDASMLSPGPAVNEATVASAPASNQSVSGTDSSQNSSACKCPGPGAGASNN